MFGSLFRKSVNGSRVNVSPEDIDILNIVNGQDFCIKFTKIIIERRYYGYDEQVVKEYTDAGYVTISQKSGRILISFNNLPAIINDGFIDCDKHISGCFNSRYVESHCIAELALDVWQDNVSHITIQKPDSSTIVAMIIFNPEGEDGDYYNLIILKTD